MKALYNLKDKLFDELDEIAHKSDLSAGDLETVHKLTDTIKNIDKICMLEDDNGYSRDGKHMVYDDYRNLNSYAGRKRDSMGRYSRDGYSRENSKEHMISELENMLSDANNEKVKSAIRKCINEIERD